MKRPLGGILFILLIVTKLLAQQQPHEHFSGRGIPFNGQSNLVAGGTSSNSTGQSGTGANINVVYHRVNWTIDPTAATKTITGTVVTYFKTIVTNVSSITFDFNTSSFNNGSLSVTYHGTICTRSSASNILTITLPSTIAASNTLDSITINYSGIPPGIVNQAIGYQTGGSGIEKYISTLSESYEDRDWWPCKADMQDKIDSMDINVTVPWITASFDTFWVASNGKLIDSTITGSTRTFKYQTRYPIASYLVFVSVAKFTRYFRSVNVSGTTVPVVYYLLRNTGGQSTVTASMDKINSVLSAFSVKFGDYPFKLEKHGFYDGLLGGVTGMEHQTFSAMATANLNDLKTLAHELAHQWFGDNVSFATWNDLWLAEGFARYGEALAGELVPSLGYTGYSARSGYKTTALGLNTTTAWIPAASIGTSDAIWNNNTYSLSVYERGAMIVSMLRAMCGDTKFFQALTNYQTALAGKTATADSLKNYFNAILGTDISGFFNAYVGGSGATAYGNGSGLGNNVDTVYWNTPSSNKLLLSVGVQTKTNVANTNYFAGPVVVRATAAGGFDTTIVFYDWGAGNLSYAGNGLSTPYGGNILSYDLSFTPTALVYDDSARTLSTGGTRKVTSIVGYNWNGGISPAWNTTTNWQAGVVPPSASQITIATTVNQPTLPGTITVGDLKLMSGTKLTIGNNNLIINGAVTGTGTITGSTSSSITINGTAGTLNFDQTSTTTRSLNNLTLGIGASATLGTALDLYGTVSLTSATLNLNAKNLTLKSNSSGTARIDDLTGSTLSGATNVTVERYIKLRSGGTGRAYRLLSSTVNTTGSIKTNWMEGQMNAAIGTNINTNPGYGTQITGSGGNANGFDKTQSNASSLYFASNAITPTYTPVTNTSGTLNALTGYFVFLRGDRSMDMTLPATTGMPTSATTLRTTGTLVQGTQASFTNALSGTAGTLNLITNPYASPIDWSLVYASSSNIATSYTFWDPNYGTRGGFVTVNTAGVASSGSATKYIQSGQAFFVQSTGGTATVSVQEDHKAAGNNNNVFRTTTTAPASFKVAMYFTEPNGYRRIADGVTAVYDDSYSAAVDGDDAIEINNWDENIAINRQGKHLAIESRPQIQDKDTIPLFMNNMKQQGYELEFAAADFTSPALQAELIDNFLGTSILLSTTDTTVVPFDITTDPASGASDRFMIVFGPMAPLAIDQMTINAIQKDQSNGYYGVQVQWTAKTETDMDRYEVERSFDGLRFSKQSTAAAVGNSNVMVNYTWYDNTAQTGNNFYRVKAFDKSGHTKYTTVANVNIGKRKPGMLFYPNPVTGNSFGLELTNMDKGNYDIELCNNIGQIVFRTVVQHPGGTALHQIALNELSNGTYQLLLRGDNGVKVTERLIKK